jgi:CHAD domain-containing protein
MAVVPPLVRLVRRRLLALFRYLPGAQAGDVGSLHRARVASRRLRELLPILALERGGAQRLRLRRPLRRVTRSLGPVRELDVTLDLLAEPEFRGAPGPAAGLVRAGVSRARIARRERMLARVAHLDLKPVDMELRTLAQTMSGLRNDRRWRAALAARLVRRATALRDRIREAGALYAPEALHRARVATKKLRYALEVADESGAAACGAPVRMLKRTQNALGELHDFQVLALHVRDADAQVAVPSKGQARALAALGDEVDRKCRAQHARYLKLAPKAAEVCDSVLREIAPAVRASAVTIARPAPVKMALESDGEAPQAREAATGV